MLQPEPSSVANIQVPYLKAGHVQWRGVELPPELPVMWASSADIKTLTPSPGDLLICEGGEVGRAALAPNDLPPNTIVQNSLHLIRESDTACPRYLKYALSHVADSGWIDLICNKATIAHLTVDKLRALPVPYWDKLNQQCIANFLDDKTAKIDALIAEKERLVERLDEYRLSVVSNVLSIGLSGKAKLVATGDTWFEAVPAEWSFCPLNYRYEVQLGKMLDEKRITGEHLRPYLRNTDVQWGAINIDGLPEMDVHPDELLRYSVQPRDLLVCEGGDVGRAAIWAGTANEVAYQKALHRVRPRTETDIPKFLFYALYDSAKRGRFADRGKATIAHLTAEAFRRYCFPFPPISEQHAIVEHLDERMSRLALLEQHSTEHIARLREYRSSLISAAVTGQIDLGS